MIKQVNSSDTLILLNFQLNTASNVLLLFLQEGLRRAWPYCFVTEVKYGHTYMFIMVPKNDKGNEIYKIASLQDKMLCMFYGWPYINSFNCPYGSDPVFRNHLETPLEDLLNNLGYFAPNMILATMNLVLGIFGKYYHYFCIPCTCTYFM